jgi:hypothetical protein
MLKDSWEGRGLDQPEVRALFTREAMLSSDWYAARLQAKQRVDAALWRRHLEYLNRFLKKPGYAEEAVRLGIATRLEHARKALEQAESADYAASLVGTLGAEPIEKFVG